MLSLYIFHCLYNVYVIYLPKYEINELVDNLICVLHTVLYLYTRSNNDKKN